MLDLKEERAFKELEGLGQRLHVPIPRAFWTLEVFDKDGKLLQRYHTRSHSWTRNFYNQIFCETAAKCAADGAFGLGKLNIKDTAAAIQSGNGTITYSSAANLDVPTDDDGHIVSSDVISRGISVGSGTNAESFDDYVLQTQIAEGTGGGQLNAIRSEGPVISENGLILINTLVRYFNNNSGGPVNINEVALVTGVYCGGGGRYNSLTTRDKLGATVTVQDTGQLKVTYTMELTYPA